MRKKIIAALTLAAVLGAGALAALAASGGDDPFVTLSYLTGTYFSQVEQDALQRAGEDAAQTAQDALDRLDDLAGGYLAQAVQEEQNGFTRLTLYRGDVLTLREGACLQFEAGQGTLEAASGVLVDVTTGAPEREALVDGHRYIAAEGACFSFTAVSDAAYLSVLGPFQLDASGQAQTPFTDLCSGEWYYPAVRFTYESKLFQGTGPTQFSPAQNMSRAMLAAVLSRLSGLSGEFPAAGFHDVPAGLWYTDAVNWAASAGVITGDGEGFFRPDADITREQMAVMLYRYARNCAGLDVSVQGDLTPFSDRGAVSDWAQEAVVWAVGAGILRGSDASLLSPGGAASRSEVAAMLQRFVDLSS